MSDFFDPYSKWLGIPTEQQPPHCYRLLGIKPFETDLELINAAADRQLARLRNHQSGENAAFSQRLLNEVSAARACLLNPTKKAAYDAQLYSAFSEQSAGQQEAPVAQTVARQSPANQAQPVKGDDPHLVDLFEEAKKDHDSSILSRSGIRKRSKNSDIHQRGPGDSGVQQSSKASESAIRRNLAELKKRKTVMWIYAGCGAGMLLAIVSLIVVLLVSGPSSSDGESNSDDGMLIVELGPKERSTVTALLIDGENISLDGTGSIKHACPPGERGIEIRRPGYRPVMKLVTLESGGEHRFAPQWKPRSLLNVEIPIAERGTAALQIDGKFVDWEQDCHASNTLKTAFALEPGIHTIAISRTGYETDTQTIDLEEGRARTIKPEGLPQASSSAIDLLTLVRIDQHSVKPGWVKDRQGLRSLQGLEGILQIPVIPPEEYLLEVDVTRRLGTDTFVLGLVKRERQITAVIDGWNPPRAALEMIDGYGGEDNQTTTSFGTLLPKDQQVSIKCYVLRSGIRLLIDGEAVIDWKDRNSQISVPDYSQVPQTNVLFLRAKASFHVSRCELLAITGKPRFPDAPASSVVKPNAPHSPIRPKSGTAFKQTKVSELRLHFARAQEEAADKVGEIQRSLDKMLIQFVEQTQGEVGGRSGESHSRGKTHYRFAKADDKSKAIEATAREIFKLQAKKEAACQLPPPKLYIDRLDANLCGELYFGEEAIRGFYVKEVVDPNRVVVTTSFRYNSTKEFFQPLIQFEGIPTGNLYRGATMLTPGVYRVRGTRSYTDQSGVTSEIFALSPYVIDERLSTLQLSNEQAEKRPRYSKYNYYSILSQPIAREVRDRNGKHLFTGILMDYRNGLAVFHTKGGNRVEMSLSRVSNEDQKWFREELLRRKSEYADSRVIGILPTVSLDWFAKHAAVLRELGLSGNRLALNAEWAKILEQIESSVFDLRWEATVEEVSEHGVTIDRYLYHDGHPYLQICSPTSSRPIFNGQYLSSASCFGEPIIRLGYGIESQAARQLSRGDRLKVWAEIDRVFMLDPERSSPCFVVLVRSVVVTDP